MTSFSTIKNAIYDWVYGNTSSTPTRWAFQNAPIPTTKPFISLRLLSLRTIGSADIRAKTVQTTAGEYHVIQNLRGVLEVQGFGAGCVEKLTNLKLSLGNPAVVQALSVSGGVEFWSTDDPVNDLSGIDGDKNEERGQFDIPFHVNDMISDIPFGLIEEVNIEVKLKKEDNTFITENLNVSLT